MRADSSLQLFDDTAGERPGATANEIAHLRRCLDRETRRRRIAEREARDLREHLSSLAGGTTRTSEPPRRPFELVDRALSQRTVDRLQLEIDLRLALERNELSVVYQPIFATADGSLAALEVLARWSHPRRGVVSPAQFIPIAEETGLILPLGDWMLERVCNDLAAWRRGPLARTPVHLNVSLEQLRDPHLARHLTAVLEGAEVASQILRLEITETVAMEDVEAFVPILEEIRRTGIGACLDDFGIGTSCLAYLLHLPIDLLKIDRCFVERLDERREHAELVRAIIELAHGFDLEVVAEGIENERQRRQLALLGADYLQGFLLAEPSDAATIESLAASWLGPTGPRASW